MNLLEGASSSSECACDLVHEADASKPSIKGSVNRYKRARKENGPPPNNLSLLSSNGNVITNDHKFDTVRLIGVKGGVLLSGESEVENITGIVPCVVKLSERVWKNTDGFTLR